MKQILQSSNVLEGKQSNGLKKFWQAHVYVEGLDRAWTGSSSWRETSKGLSSVIHSEPYEVFPKNVGRSNETNVIDQAILEFKSDVQKKKDKGYCEAGETHDTILPMLAHKFKDDGAKMVWPCFVQPKLNGQRMLYDGYNAWSRGGKPIPNFEGMDQFHGVNFDGMIVDGELILEGNLLLQETTKARKHNPTALVYKVYDLVIPDMPFSERYALLEQIIKRNAAPAIQLVPTDVALDENEVLEAQSRFVGLGFEGTMIRSDYIISKKEEVMVGYEVNKRSYSLQKYKDFVDEEFIILRVENQGGGKSDGLAKFICKSNVNDNEFAVKPEGSDDNAREMFRNRKKLIGKYLTVRYQELTKDKIPQFGVGVEVRELGDF